MRKILLIGTSGSGKGTFTKNLAKEELKKGKVDFYIYDKANELFENLNKEAVEHIEFREVTLQSLKELKGTLLARKDTNRWNKGFIVLEEVPTIRKNVWEKEFDYIIKDILKIDLNWTIVFESQGENKIKLGDLKELVDEIYETKRDVTSFKVDRIKWY